MSKISNLVLVRLKRRKFAVESVHLSDSEVRLLRDSRIGNPQGVPFMGMTAGASQSQTGIKSCSDVWYCWQHRQRKILDSYCRCPGCPNNVRDSRWKTCLDEVFQRPTLDRVCLSQRRRNVPARLAQFQFPKSVLFCLTSLRCSRFSFASFFSLKRTGGAAKVWVYLARSL